MRPSTTARRYAEAAFAVAQQDGDLDQWNGDLERSANVWDRELVQRFFEDPKTSRDEKVKILPELFPDFRPHILNLLKLLAVRNRLHLLPGIAVEFQHLVREAKGILEADVTVARPVSDQERQDIADRLGRATGKKVDITVNVEPDIIGGIVIRVGDHLIDASIAGRLQRLRQDLAV